MLTGKYNINVYFKAVVLLKLHNKHPTNTVPLLLIPGIMVTASISPIIMASLSVISLSSFEPLIPLTMNNRIAVIINAIAKYFILYLFSKTSLKRIPVIPTGIVLIIMYKQYLNLSLLITLLSLLIK